MAVNQVIISGRLTRDIELRHTNSGKATATFTVAVDRNTGEGNQADFPRVTVWGDLAERCAKYIGKGCRVIVVGSLHTDSYKDKDGNNVNTTYVSAYKIDFTDFKQTAEAAAQATAPYEEQQASMVDIPLEDSFTALDEDVPF